MRKPTFLPGVVTTTLLETGMEEISGLAAIREGEESQAYRFQSHDRGYIVRINQEVRGFEKDAFAYHNFGRAELPIPEVIHIGQIEEVFFCVSEELPGVTLQDLPARDVPVVLDPTAQVLRAIAESKIDAIRDFGQFDSAGCGEFRSWHDFLMSITDRQRYDWVTVGELLSGDEIGRVSERLVELIQDCPEARALIHGDFGSNNVLTDGRGITGVLDWSEASIGDPLYDIADILFWRNWLECMREQALYFEIELTHSTTVRNRLLCYQLRIGLAEIYQNLTENKLALANWALARCRELIRKDN